MSFEIGQRIGDYEIVSILGAGGMGEVYKVRHVISDRVEAMKVLLPNLSSDPDGADRFLREIKVQASLDHPNIAALHTALRVDNQLLMVMEYVEGTTLEALMQSGAIGRDPVVDYVIQVLSALSYAHSRGVVHRDIKPANMMLTPAGQIKLMDFGIARATQDRRLTQTGRTVGSLFYMSPEQINGQLTDGRSDLYSLGITLYELVTGRRPFDGDSDFSIMAAHLQQNPIPPVQLDPHVPMALNEVILMAIAKDADARFQSAEAFRLALERARSMPYPVGQPSTQPPQQSPAYAINQDPQHTQQHYPQEPQPYQQAPQPYQQTQQPFAGQPYGAPPAPAQYGAQPGYGASQQQHYMPAPPAVQAEKSSRGLYMAVGSLVTVAVLALAIVKGPDLMKTLAGSQSKDSTPQTPLASQQNPGQTPQSQPHAAQDPQQSQTPADTPIAQTPPPQAPESQTPPTSAPSTSTSPTSTSPTSTAANKPPARNPPPSSKSPPRETTARMAPQERPQQYQQSQPPAYQQPPPQQQQPQQANNAAAQRAAALNEARERHNDLAIRAGTAREGLSSIKQQMANQGLGLRADIREAETRMSYQLKEAVAAIRAGDVEGAKRNLDMATRAIETVERFLGR